jgi:spore germination protein YaaH
MSYFRTASLVALCSLALTLPEPAAAAPTCPTKLRAEPFLGCAAKLSGHVYRKRPTAPRRLRAVRVTDRRARLRWSRSRRGIAPVIGYRLYRDGKTVRQFKRRSVRVRLVSGRRYRFSVAAVDSRGRRSRRSKPVIVRTKHYPPMAPRALDAAGVTDTELSLSWPQSKRRSRRIVGYRVFRNSVPLRQVSTTGVRAASLGTRVTNLAPATAYTFTVVAVDSLGRLSGPSSPLSVTTAPPPPTEGSAHAFLLATTGRSFQDFQAHYRQIGTVYPTYFDCLANATIVGRDDPLVTGYARLRKVAVMPRINCQNGQTLKNILTNPATRTATLDRIVGLVDTYGYDGINIDFESGDSTLRNPLTSFVSTLASRLHARGQRISVEVSAKRFENQGGRPAFYDYRALGAVADYVFVMNWGLHWATSKPGAMDDLWWAFQVADYVASMPNKKRFVLGTPMYGMDWPNGGGPSNPATALEYEDIMALAARVGKTPVLDKTAYSWHFSYTDGNGIPHEVWFGDATTIDLRIRMARNRGLGIGFWRLGAEDQRTWANSLIAPGVVWP